MEAFDCLMEGRTVLDALGLPKCQKPKGLVVVEPDFGGATLEKALSGSLSGDTRRNGMDALGGGRRTVGGFVGESSDIVCDGVRGGEMSGRCRMTVLGACAS